jgi:predicted RNA-binding protein (virulence factor B family)
MSPEEIRDAFSLSKKAFKRAIGRLLADRRVQLDTEGTVRLLAKRR